MVGRRGHGANAEEPSRKAALDSSLKSTVAITSVIDTLEKRKCAGIKWLSWGKTITQRLNGNLIMVRYPKNESLHRGMHT